MYLTFARLAQMVERTAFNRMVVGSSPTVGTFRYGLVVRIAGFHPVGRGSIPRIGNIRQVSRVVKGGRLKIYCVSFMGSNPILVIIFKNLPPKKCNLYNISLKIHIY